LTVVTGRDPSFQSSRRATVAVLLAVATLLGALAVGAAVGRTASAAAGDDAASTFASAPLGFATGTTGGAGRPVIVVQSLADTGAGSLREALATGGDVRFAAGLTGTITQTKVLEIPGDTTIDGRGAQITIKGRGFNVTSKTNVIIRNLRFRQVQDDALAIKFSDHVWLDHLDMADGGSVATDGLIDATRGSTDLTVSWSRFSDHRKVMLLGWQDPEGSPGPVRMTLHHNLFTDIHRRAPQARHGYFEITNNVYVNWGRTDDDIHSKPFAVGSSCGAAVLVRGNVFEPAGDPDGVYLFDELACDPTHAPVARQSANLANGAALHEREPDTVPDPPAATAVPVEPATSALRGRVASFAGWQSVGYPTDTSTTTSTVPGVLNPVLAVKNTHALRLSWTAAPGADRYEWRLLTCAGAVVTASDTAATLKEPSNLAAGCYRALVRPRISGTWRAYEQSNDIQLGSSSPTSSSTSSSTTTTSSSTTTTASTTTTTASTTTTTASTTTTTTTTPSAGTLKPVLVKKRADAVVLSWTADPTASRYVWRLLTCAGTVVVSSDTAATEKTVSTLPRGCYRGEVKARRASGLGPAELSATVTL
jgi:pectate lyase